VARRKREVCCPETYCATVKVGERGQIVIPYEFREALKIKPGDSLIVCREGRFLKFFKSEEIMRMIRQKKF
jgi:AbrB family looped-hinge helix DNA binding protein